MQKKKDSQKIVDIKNKKVFHDFFVGDAFEAGIVLKGTEVKSIRDGKVQLSDSFVRINRTGEAFLFNANISEYDFGNLENHEPTRTRKLLLNKSELRKLRIAIEKDGGTVLPIKMYFSHGIVKVEIAVCRAKKLFDKREDMKNSTELREAQRAVSDLKRR